MFVLSDHLLSPEDHLLLDLVVFHNYLSIICLCLGKITCLGMIEEYSDGFRVQPLRDLVYRDKGTPPKKGGGSSFTVTKLPSSLEPKR